FIEDAMGDFALAEFGERQVPAIRGGKRDHVGIDVEAGSWGGDVIGDDQVGVLLFKLLTRVQRYVVGLGGEADHKPVALFAGHGRENVGVGHELEPNALLGAAFDLVRGRFRGAVVGNG